MLRCAVPQVKELQKGSKIIQVLCSEGKSNKELPLTAKVGGPRGGAGRLHAAHAVLRWAVLCNASLLAHLAGATAGPSVQRLA